MTTHNNGGPAFPCEVGPASDGHTIQTGNMQWMQSGMHLRDYFAAKAMRLYFLGEDSASLSGDPKQIAAWSYAMADAMLKAREPA